MRWWIDLTNTNLPADWPLASKVVPVVTGRHQMDFDIDESAMTEADLNALWDYAARGQGYESKNDMPINKTMLPMGSNADQFRPGTILKHRDVQK